MKTIANLFLIILLILFLSFFYQGITTDIPVSEDYNIPIAMSIVTGDFLYLHSDNPYFYFPGSSHVFLALFLMLGLPVNLFGLVSWIFLFIVCKKLAEIFGLSLYLSIIFAGSVSTTMAVIRTVEDQSIDKWLCAWFVLALLLLEKSEKSWKGSMLLGLSLGMLIGTKYSGPLFFIALLLVYGKRLLQYFKPLQLVVTSVIFTVTGLFWYIRNFFLTGNPYFPANIPFFKGYPDFAQQDWMLWKVIITYPQGNLDLVNAFISEYLIWAFSGVVLVVVIIYWYQKKQTIDARIKRLSILGFTTGLAALFLPITTPYNIELFHIISDMRYIYIVMVVVMLAIFLIAKKYKQEVSLATIALINTIPVFTFMSYLPKIYIISIVFSIWFSLRGSRFLEKLYRL